MKDPSTATLARRGACGAAGLALWLAAAPAAAVDCNTLPSPVYGTGGSAQKPLLARLAARMASLPAPRTLIYQAPGACVGVNALFASTRVTGQASYWSAAGMELTCDLPVAGQVPDFASSGTQATLCAGITALPADLGDFEGPISTWNFFVPVASSQRSISTEAAYFVYGFGHDGMASPWTDESVIIRRDANSAAQIVVALETGVPAASFRGVDAMTNARSISLVAMATANPEGAIGFASGENADPARATVRTLAFQHTGQTCGYWPDSTATAFDKRNVRDGLYWLWTTSHFFARVDASRHIVNPIVRDFVGWFTGDVAPPTEVPILDLSILNGNIPNCAMRVTRSRDLGPLASYAPPAPCGCYFDHLATGSTTCASCTESSTCPSSAPVCRHGYCEVN